MLPYAVETLRLQLRQRSYRLLLNDAPRPYHDRKDEWVSLVLLRPVVCCRRDILCYKRGRPLRELQDQVGVVVFHLVDSLHLRIPQESPFFAVALKNELLRRRFRLVLAFATCLAIMPG